MNPDKKAAKYMITCQHCGAPFSVHEARCPYCDQINPSGAEKDYMRKLHNLREETEGLADGVQHSVSRELRHNSRKLVRILVIIILIIAVIITAFRFMIKRTNEAGLRNKKGRAAFMEQHFSELDRLYDEGNIEELYDYAMSLEDDPYFSAIYQWKHYGLLDYHTLYLSMKTAIDDIESGDRRPGAYTAAAWAAVTFTGIDPVEYQSSYLSPFPEEDIPLIAGYQAEAEAFLVEKLHFEKDELDDLAKEVVTDGMVDMDLLEKRLEPVYREIGIIT